MIIKKSGCKKYNIEIETHCHSIISSHATSTLSEHINVIKTLGMKGLCLTNHAPLYNDGTTESYFEALKSSPKIIEGINFYPGAEVNISDYNGTVDLQKTTLAGLKWVIAAIHTNCLKRASEKDITNTYLKALENPFIDCLGHIGQTYYMCDFEKVVKKAKECGKIIEINNSSLSGMRPGSEMLCFNVALMCKKYETNIVVSSDAHNSKNTGNYAEAFKLLESVAFPDDLILNSDSHKFDDYILKKRGK